MEKEFYLQDTIKVARNLLGKVFVSEIFGMRLSGIIVETEAYKGFFDSASHGSKGKTKKCEVMYNEGGCIFVYLTYGIHYMLNFVTEDKNYPAAVLIRAMKPLEGIEKMIERRGTKNVYKLLSGPGKLTQAFGITNKLNGVILSKKSGVWVQEPDSKVKQNLGKFKVARSPRIGINYADEISQNYLSNKTH